MQRNIDRTSSPLRVRFQDAAITPPLFAISFGFAGLSGAWRLTGEHWTTVVADLLAAMSAVLAAALAIPWVAELVRRETSLSAELRAPVLGPSGWYAASRVGGVVVIALVPVLLGAGGASSLAQPLAGNYRSAMLVMAGLSVVAAAITALFVARGRTPGAAALPPAAPGIHACAMPQPTAAPAATPAFDPITPRTRP